jgi:hypothetical protein
MEPARAPDCFRCRSFLITHDAERPYGCRVFAIKSRVLPSLEVWRSSGRACQAFEAKAEGSRAPHPHGGSR